MHQFHNKLMAIKCSLRHWNSTWSGNIFSRVHHAKEVMCQQEKDYNLLRDEVSKIALNGLSILHKGVSNAM